MKTALVYDRVNKWGGAERLLLSLRKIFPSAVLYTSVYHPQNASWAANFSQIHPSFLQKIKFARHRHEMLAPFMPIAFESHDFREYDLVISVTSEACKGIITLPHTLHLCICLTPTRYLWSHEETYFNSPLKRFIAFPLVWYLKQWDKYASLRPDILVSISKTVSDRILKYYNRESEIIYPPVEFPVAARASLSSIQKVRELGEFYLIVSRLVPYKRVDVAIEAFNRMKDKKLVVVGTGSDFGYLKSISKKNIIFKGHLTDNDLSQYYRNCKALVFPQEEDFGLTSVEAQMFGKPVIAYKKGGAVETVVEGKTGVFFESQTLTDLIAAISTFEKNSYDRKTIIQNAQRFSFDVFKRNIERVLKRHGISI